ncbi:MAG TPA: ATP-binding protein, partial [Candidatus Ozemobacteraceae bacterium]|nr:ATP-binding protein [Candidatus Ozemobacteraceae bacterium]
MTRQLLAFARKQTVTPRVLDLNDTVEGMLKMLRRIIGEDITLTWRPGKNLWPVCMDPVQIDQILANLCVNSRDAISGTGRVTIETGMTTLDQASATVSTGITPGDFVYLAISDDGCGMDAATVSHLFEPFFTTKELGKGTGLGLATVYGIVRQNNGGINVYSEPGRGTTFKVYLPRHRGVFEERSLKTSPEKMKTGNELVLLVEDEAAILKLTERMLKQLGYRVLAATTPSAAFRLVDEQQGAVQLLVTDVIMPEMNGRELREQLNQKYPKLRTLFMSGYTSDHVQIQEIL